MSDLQHNNITRFITTKRPYNGDIIDWILTHYDQLDRTLLREAVQHLGVGRVTNQQWTDFWANRGHKKFEDAEAHAERKGLRTIVRVDKGDVYEALTQIGAGL